MPSTLRPMPARVRSSPGAGALAARVPGYDVIVVGGGHAGTEAAWAAASVLRHAAGLSSDNPVEFDARVEADAPVGPGPCCRPRVALITMDPARLGQMSCNPAIGGLAKGQIVREIDALGGLMGRAIDATGIMFKVLNASKGPAVRGPRAQADKYEYAVAVQFLLAHCPDIEVVSGLVEDLEVVDGRIRGVRLASGGCIVRPDPAAIAAFLRGGGGPGAGATRARGAPAPAEPIYGSPARRVTSSDRAGTIGPPASDSGWLRAGAVVLTTGTFMRALMHTGDERSEGGRVGEGSAVGISGVLARLGFELGRLKTGTPPRLRAGSIDWAALEPQAGDAVPRPFSTLTPDGVPGGRFPRLAQVECRITRTTGEAHALIRANLHRAPMYSGAIEAECGPRYCPSIEDKVVRFADRDSHQVFLEPESLSTDEVYCNGISTSLPADVQSAVVRAMPGCERAEILRFGYAVEYDMVWPHQIDATTMTKRVDGLFLAGQINCTTGYEEAAAQGVVSGLNAARFSMGQEPVRLGRDEALIGVLLDDLVTKTPREPYRMFTSRAEYRLHLRGDNADRRLTPRGRRLGLIDEVRSRAFDARESARESIRAWIAQGPRIADQPLAERIRRPEVSLGEIQALLAEAVPGSAGAHAKTIDLSRLEEVVTEIRYAPYLERERAQARRHHEGETRPLPAWLDYRAITGLRAEAAEVLARFRPATFGQASRLAGVNPADLTLVSVAIRKGPTPRSGVTS